jgi:capsid protein
MWDQGEIVLPAGAPDLWDAYAAYTTCAWIGPARGWVDPVKEVTASVMRMEAGISNLDQESSEAGNDWKDVAIQRAYEREFYASLGLPEPSLQIMPETAAATAPDADPDEADSEDAAEQDAAGGTSRDRGNARVPAGPWGKRIGGRIAARGRSRIPRVAA